MPVAGQLGNAAGAGVTRWLGVGVSGLVDARCAAAAAARDAVAGRRPGLVWVSDSGDRDPAALAAGVGEVAAGVPLIGGNVGGEICGDGSSTGSVLVVALGGSGFTVATGCGLVGEVGLGGAGEQAASCVAAISDRPHQVLVVLSDAGTGDQQEVLRGAYRVAGRRCRWWVGPLRNRRVAPRDGSCTTERCGTVRWSRPRSAPTPRSGWGSGTVGSRSGSR